MCFGVSTCFVMNMQIIKRCGRRDGRDVCFSTIQAKIRGMKYVHGSMDLEAA